MTIFNYRLEHKRDARRPQITMRAANLTHLKNILKDIFSENGSNLEIDLGTKDLDSIKITRLRSIETRL